MQPNRTSGGEAASAWKKMPTRHTCESRSQWRPKFRRAAGIDRALAGGTDDPGYVGVGGLANSKREGGGMMGLASAIASRRKRAGTTVSGVGTGAPEPAAAPVPAPAGASSTHRAHAGAVDVLGVLGEGAAPIRVGGGRSRPSKVVSTSSQGRDRMRSSHGDEARTQ